MSYQKYGYRVALPEHPEAIVFVIGMLARNITGWLWMWRQMNSQLQSVRRATGCVQVKGGIVGPNELLMVVYWKDTESMRAYFKSPQHLDYMSFLVKHPESLTLWNETYQPTKSGMYLHEPHGLSQIYERSGYRKSEFGPKNSLGPEQGPR